MEARRSSAVDLSSLEVVDEDIEPKLGKDGGNEQGYRDSVEGDEEGSGGGISVITEHQAEPHNNEERCEDEVEHEDLLGGEIDRDVVVVDEVDLAGDAVDKENQQHNQ